jgi:predicted transcriptional regulator
MQGSVLKRLDGIARAMSRSRSWVINQALVRYLDYEEWFVHEVKQALKEVDEGELVDHAVVVRKWEKKREASMVTRR